jgi:hypothetical protein
VACGVPSKYPNPPTPGPRPNNVGNGNDLSAAVSPALISTAVGSFDSVSPANVTETGPWAGNPTSANALTLQINSQFFTTPACNGVAGCLGWQQFKYSQNQCGGPCVFMEYKLIGFGSPCPSATWNQSGNSCWFNSASTVAPAVTAAQLQGTKLTGTASATTDTVVLTTAGGNATATAQNSVVSLSQQWNIAEFNIFGDCSSTQANFSAGTTAVVRIALTDGTQTKPVCTVAGFTAETNNLNFSSTAPASSGAAPALLFTQSSAGGLVGCAAATSVGDTHLTTFGNTLYDFQASGEFVLAETASPAFSVQARQLSGAPTWPNATLNKGVAACMSKTQVAVCLADIPLFIDGKRENLADGKSIVLPDGVDISRHGHIYPIRDRSGDSLRAELNGTYINVAVGLGRWPAKVSGVLANANQNVQQVAARDGAVLTAPFPFTPLYHHFADSWRVPVSDSMLSVCGEQKGEPGFPSKPFHAADLDPQTYKSARAACTEAGVKAGPHFDACMIDVAVIGTHAAAKVFVGVRPPVAVGETARTARLDRDRDREAR